MLIFNYISCRWREFFRWLVCQICSWTQSVNQIIFIYFSVFIVSFRLYAAHTQDDCFLILNNPSLYPLHQINDCSKRNSSTKFHLNVTSNEKLFTGLSEEDRLREKGFIKCLYSHCTKTCLFGWIKHESGCYTCECASINENCKILKVI